MGTGWKDKTCETCGFQVDGLCRKRPPKVHFIGAAGTEVVVYPPINNANTLTASRALVGVVWMSACAEYKPVKSTLLDSKVDEGERGPVI